MLGSKLIEQDGGIEPACNGAGVRGARAGSGILCCGKAESFGQRARAAVIEEPQGVVGPLRANEEIRVLRYTAAP